MKKKILSMVISLVMAFSFAGVMPAMKVGAAKLTASEIVARADELYNLTWTPLKTIYGYGKNSTFNVGNSYHLPYGMPVNTNTFIGYYLGVYDFINETKNATSKLYTSSSGWSGSGYSNAWYCPYYAMDCSSFVSYCWGISKQTTSGLPSYSTNLGKCNSTNIGKLQIGDALNSSGHVVLVTDISNGNIEITEETPPQLKRTTYTSSQLVSKYSSYSILRYAEKNPNPVPPTNAKLSIDKSSYSLGEKISFKISCDNCDEMFLPVDYNGKRIEFINVTGTNAYTYTPSQAGTYGFYIVGRNPNGDCSSDYCAVKVFSGKPTNAKLSLDKSSYSLGEKISFKISCDNCDEMFLPVDYNGKRIEFINVTGTNAYTYTPSQAGTYGFYIVGRNPNGDCSSDYCEVKVFSGKPTNAKLTLDKSSYNLGEKISFEFSCDNIGELFLPVDYNGKRIEFINVTGTDAYTYAPSQAGTYGFYIIGRNSNGDCSSEYKEIKVHKYESKLIASTCTEKGYTLHTCSACGDNYKDTYVNAKGHSWGSWTTSKNATCTADGSKTRSCTRSGCTHKETQTIAKTGHDYITEKISASYTEDGYTKHTCKTCGDSFKDNFVKKPKGDMNNDGNVMIADVVMIQRCLTKTIDISTEQVIAADLNEDGKFNVFDLIIVKRMVLNS